MSLQRVSRSFGRQSVATLLATVVVFTVPFLPGCASAPEQRTFSTPEEAVDAMVRAAQEDNEEGLLGVFGSEAEDLMSSGDPVYDRRQREIVLVAFQQGWSLADIDPDTKELIIGDESWPFPIPLVKDQSGWRFDTEAGEEEVLTRRIGRNELSVIRICHTYVQAQNEYARQGHDGKPAGIYAQRTSSETGKQNGLYWAVGPGEKPSPLGALVAEATAEGYGINPRPFHGYFFRILTAQGKDAPGGARSYIEDGEMTGGFALVAYPGEYADSGVMTFMINRDGILYEKDLGDETSELASQIQEYNPDSTWTEVE